MDKYVIYLRVSTQRQEKSGLGLESQKDSCMNYINSQKGILVNEFIDIESGGEKTRTGILQAIDYCKINNCTLVIAKLDRLARDVEFTFKVINTGINIYICDMPNINTLMLGVMASVAQYERELISIRTKAALAAKKKRNEQTGGTKELWGKNNSADRERTINQIQSQSASKRKIEAQKNENNRFFWAFISRWIVDKGEPKNGEIWADIAANLNELGQCTASGMEYTASRAAAMYRKLKRIMN